MMKLQGKQQNQMCWKPQ